MTGQGRHVARGFFGSLAVVAGVLILGGGAAAGDIVRGFDVYRYTG